MVNNIPIWCGGSDWIPADNFIPRISKERYYDWVKLVADGNQFMIRVWGGGIYEEQAFYDACDELGILERKGANVALGLPAIANDRSGEPEMSRSFARRLGFR